MLRCTQLGLHYDDLENMDMGMVYDMLAEKERDTYEWDEEADEAYIDAF